MAGGFSINATLNASKFLRGVKDIDGALEDLEGSLDDVADEVEKIDKGDGFKDLKKDADKAEDAASDLEKRLRKVRDEAKDVGKATDSIGDDGSRNFRKMGDTAEEVSGELRQNLGETFSSFRGDIEDLPQIAQDVFGGLAGSVGGLAGAFALAGGAAGIGLIIAAVQTLNADAEAAQQYANDLANAYIDAGGTVLDTITLASRVSEVLTDPDQRKEAEKLADLLGIELPEAVRILAGDTNALEAARQTLRKEEEKLQDTREDGRLLDEQEAAALADRQYQLDQVTGILNKQGDANTYASDTAREYSDALKGMIEDAGTASVEVDELGNRVYTLPDGVQIFVDAETGQATTKVDKFKGDVDGVPETVKTTALFDSSGASAGLNNWISQNNGKTIKIYGKYISPAGSSIP